MPANKNAQLETNLSPSFVKRGDAVKPNYSDANVSNPPTDAELDSAFDVAADLNTVVDPFLAIVNDAGLGSAVWLVVATGGSWYYIGPLTLAT